MSASGERCGCPCHVGSIVPEPAPRLTDVVAAATACDTCRPAHTVVFRRATMPERPPTSASDAWGEGPE